MKPVLAAFSFLLAASLAGVAAPPVDDPAARFALPWTGAIRWKEVVDVSTVEGDDADEKLARAQEQLAASGGGVVFFPAGEYRFRESIRLMDGVVLRGVPPQGEMDARKDGFRLATRFEFPKYEFRAAGEGTPIESAFKGIEVAAPGTASHCGLVHVAVHRGHVLFRRAADGSCGRNRLVLGCILTNTAVADPAVPDAQLGQKPWQRFTWRFGAAIDVHSGENLLVAGNRLARSGGDNFTMDGYVMKGRRKPDPEVDGVVFDYDNRLESWSLTSTPSSTSSSTRSLPWT